MEFLLNVFYQKLKNVKNKNDKNVNKKSKVHH